MRIFYLSLVFAILLIYCGDENGDNSSGSNNKTCKSPSGYYYVEYTELSGNCGPMPDDLLNLNKETSSSTSSIDCWDMYRNVSPDNCRIEFGATCSTSCSPEEEMMKNMYGSDIEPTFSTENIVTFDPSMDFAEGIFEVTIICYFSSCNSTYDVSYTAQ